MTPDELKAAARRCLYAKQFHEAGHVSSAMLAVAVQDAAALAEAYTKLQEATVRLVRCVDSLTGYDFSISDDTDDAVAAVKMVLGIEEGV